MFSGIRSDPGRVVKYYGTRPNYYCSSYPYPGCHVFQAWYRQWHVCSTLHIAIITICTAAFFFCYTFTAISIDAVSIFYGHAITTTFTTAIASIHASFSNAAVICATFAFCWPQQLRLQAQRLFTIFTFNIRQWFYVNIRGLISCNRFSEASKNYRPSCYFSHKRSAPRL